MIDIKNKVDCCGCEGCVQVCPVKCISFNEDEEGFRYPLVNQELCIHCDLCEKVCPVIHQNEPRKPLKVYAAKNNNKEIWEKSSSGGVFTPVAEDIIAQGGVVFGAAFDEQWVVKHIMVDTVENLGKLRKSKYVQSLIGDTYKKAKEYLKKGVPVLFSGTHCQIAGLHRFLRKKYDNLYTVDVLCYGVPSPLVWRDYVNYKSNGAQIDKIEFRHKIKNTQQYLSIISGGEELCEKEWGNDLYIRGFGDRIFIRPSCFECPSRKGKSCSDLSIADYWGIQNVAPDFVGDIKGGISLVLTYTDKGQNMFHNANLEHIETSYDDALRGNPCLERSVERNSKFINMFWKLYPRKNIEAIKIINKEIHHISLFKRIRLSARYRLSLILKSIIKK